MKKILILNFGSQQDIIASAHFIGSYKNEFSDAEITVLTYKKNLLLTETIANIKNICTIDKERIHTIMNSPVYSDGFALNEFSDSIAALLDTEWDKVFNYSNDSVSAYLVRSFTSKEQIGTYIGTDGVANTPGIWTTYQNYVSSKMTKQCISRVEIRNHMALTPQYFDVEKIKINSKYSILATQNFSRIRKMGHSGQPSIIVGISLEAGHDAYMPSTNSYRDVIEALVESNLYIPVLLVNGKTYQTELVNELNSYFKNSLISVNVSSHALSAVISNVDILMSQSNVHTGIADAMGVRVIECRDLAKETSSHLVVSPDNYIIYQESDTSIANDIILCINEEFETELPINQLTTVNKTYKTLRDDFGVFTTQIRGQLDLQAELNYHIGRSFHFEILGYPRNSELIKNIAQNTEKDVLETFVTHHKSELTTCVKLLLTSLRSVKNATSSKSSLNSFIMSLDNLMRSGGHDTVISSVVRLFEGEVENISSTDAHSNLKSIEALLFALKNNLQILTSTISDIVDTDAAQTQNMDMEAQK